MTIRDVLIMSANLLNLADVKELETVTAENCEEIMESNKVINKLYKLALTCLREICFNYLPVISEAEISAVDGKIDVNELENFVKLVKVKQNDKLVNYKFKNGIISVDTDDLYTIQYIQNPNINSMLDHLDIFADLSPDILVLGICAYYSISMGMYDEFEYYHDEYTKRAEAIKKLGIYQLPNRRWL